MLTTTRVLLVSLRAAAVAAVALAGAVGGPAAALPTHEINWDYYSDATYTEIVGGRTLSCSGNGGRWGIKTDYVKIETGPPCDYEPPYPGWNDPPEEWWG